MIPHCFGYSFSCPIVSVKQARTYHLGRETRQGLLHGDRHPSAIVLTLATLDRRRRAT